MTPNMMLVQILSVFYLVLSIQKYAQYDIVKIDP